LSIYAAQAGAGKVFSVEASNLALLSAKIIEENGFSDTIEVVNCKIEDFRLPNNLSYVDIIISEFMGFYLLHEGMLDSVLMARDKFLKPNGLLFPDRCVLYLSPCSLPSLFDNWENMCGIKMTRFAEQLRNQKSKKPEILSVNDSDLLSDDITIAFFDLNDITVDELDKVEFNEVVVAKKSGKFQGKTFFFYCSK
jgi:type I protein arginine methyltransferase